MTILITAATGHLGRLVIDHLIARGAAPSDIVAGTRRPENASDLAAKGARVVRLDYDDPATIAEAVAGVSRVLLISGTEFGRRIAQHTAVIDAAAAEGVSLLVYTSSAKADSSELILVPEHKATEEAIASSGIPSVILRNSAYAEIFVPNVEQARHTGELVASVGDALIAPAARDDFAEAAAVVLLTDGHAGKTYELAGDARIDYHQVAAGIGEAIGRDVRYRSVTAQEHAAALAAAGVPDQTAGFLVAIDQGIGTGGFDVDDHTLSELIGRPTTPFAEALRAAL